MANISHFRPERLPPADVFFRDNVEKFRARGRRATGLCPFHEDTNPSLSIDLERGLFHCFACGVSGDIIRFVELRDKCSPKRAAISLGAWDGAVDIDKVIIHKLELERHQEQEKQAAREREHQELIRMRNWLHRIEAIYREAIEGLRPDDEVGWAIAALAFDEVVDAEAEYFHACGLERWN
jgi:hypothetical protein